MKYICSVLLLISCFCSCLRDESEIQLDYNPFDENYTSPIGIVEEVNMETIENPIDNNRYKFTISYRLEPAVYSYIQGLDARLENGIFALRLFRNSSLFPIRGEYDFQTSTYDYNLGGVAYQDLVEDMTYTYSKYFFSKPDQICVNFVLEYLDTSTPERYDFCWEF